MASRGEVGVRLVCPVCAEALSDAGGALVCSRGHTFDRAREGYVDLLPPGYGRTSIGGDSVEMIAARRRFLAAGHYDPLVDAVIRAVGAASALRRDAPATGIDGPLVLDVGCGDGYYGGRVAEALRQEHGSSRLYGLDISRAALKVAARTYRSGTFFRNDIATRIGVSDGAVDVLLDVFAPRNPAEFARVLRPGGLAVVVIPDESHLHELRSALPLLTIPPDKRDRTIDQLSGKFTLTDESTVHYAMHLPSADVLDLVRMSPSAHHIDDTDLRNLRDMHVTAAFRILSLMPSQPTRRSRISCR